MTWQHSSHLDFDIYWYRTWNLPSNHFANNFNTKSFLKVEAIGRSTSYDSLCEQKRPESYSVNIGTYWSSSWTWTVYGCNAWWQTTVKYQESELLWMPQLVRIFNTTPARNVVKKIDIFLESFSHRDNFYGDGDRQLGFVYVIQLLHNIHRQHDQYGHHQVTDVGRGDLDKDFL